MRDFVRDLFFHYYSDSLAVALPIPNADFEVLTALYATTFFSLSHRLTATEKLSLSSIIKDKIFVDYITTSKKQASFNERVLEYYSIDTGFKPDGIWVFSDTFPMVQDSVTSCVILLGDFLCAQSDHNNLDSKFLRTFEKQTMSFVYDLFRAYSLQISILPCSEIVGSKYYSEAMYPVEDDHYYEAQFARAGRSNDIPSSNITIYEESQFGSFVGLTQDSYAVTRNSCSCLDFKKRRLPCKHMYRLREELDNADAAGLYIPHYPLKPLSSLSEPPEYTDTQEVNKLADPIEKPKPEPTSATAKNKSFKEKLSNLIYALLAHGYLILLFLVCPLLLVLGLKSCIDNHNGRTTHTTTSHRSISTTNNYTYWNIPEQQDTTDFVLNTESMIVHFPWCGSVPHINPDNYETCKSLQTALNQGYRKCELCDPYEVKTTKPTPSLAFPEPFSTSGLSPAASALLEDWDRRNRKE